MHIFMILTLHIIQLIEYIWRISRRIPWPMIFTVHNARMNGMGQTTNRKENSEMQSRYCNCNCYCYCCHLVSVLCSFRPSFVAIALNQTERKTIAHLFYMCVCRTNLNRNCNRMQWVSFVKSRKWLSNAFCIPFSIITIIMYVR